MEAHKIDIFSCGKSKMDTTTLIINMKSSTSSTEKNLNWVTTAQGLQLDRLKEQSK
jgi:hypothetical protein